LERTFVFFVFLGAAMNTQERRLYDFGPFRIDAQKRTLLCNGETVPLAPKAFDTLLILVQHAGEVLEKDRLIEILWPDSFVEEGNLTYNISAIRKALGETPNERRYVITVPGRGYRFAADVKTTQDEVSDLVVGRYSKSTIVIQDQKEELEQKPPGLLAAFVSSIGRSNLVFVSVALAIVALGVTALYYLPGKEEPTSKAIHSIAILPFIVAGADPNAEYLGDGITESLINRFSRLSQLKVTARTTAFRYKGKDADAQAVGRDLRVDAIVTGRVTQQGDTLIVQADLLSTADGSQVWGERYSRRLADIFVVQEQIAKDIAENLRLKLTGEERQGLSKRYTGNIRAYKNYLLGWTYLQRRTRQDFFTAISYYEKAIEEEPEYALAYAALTEAYVSLGIRGFIEPGEGRRKAEEAARKALELDQNLAEAHAAIGETHVFFAPFDLAAGDRELRRAIELSPSLAIAHQVLGASLLEQGRLDEALEVWLRAREIDPLSPILARLEAFSYLLKREYPKSLELLRQSYELGPPFIIWSEVEIYIRNGRLDQALAELDEERRERRDDPVFVYGSGMVYAAQGKRAEALEMIRELQQVSGPSSHRAAWIAMIYAALNEKEQALGWLERGLEARAISIFYKDQPVWEPIRSEQRFRDLLVRMGIPQ
jgi:TolB-like protein/DNA-binding winged helix-turn-helix (wHTH) protein/Flp pilus assembly protein TadD